MNLSFVYKNTTTITNWCELGEDSLMDFGKIHIPVLNSIAKWGREVGEEKGKIIHIL